MLPPFNSGNTLADFQNCRMMFVDRDKLNRYVNGREIKYATSFTKYGSRSSGPADLVQFTLFTLLSPWSKLFHNQQLTNNSVESKSLRNFDTSRIVTGIKENT